MSCVNGNVQYSLVCNVTYLYSSEYKINIGREKVTFNRTKWCPDWDSWTFSYNDIHIVIWSTNSNIYIWSYVTSHMTWRHSYFFTRHEAELCFSNETFQKGYSNFVGIWWLWIIKLWNNYEANFERVCTRNKIWKNLGGKNFGLQLAGMDKKKECKKLYDSKERYCFK